MKTFAIIFFINSSIIIGIVIAGIILYNSLIYKKNQVDNAFSSIDVLLQKRWDLIPNLVAVAQQYMKFEQQTLTEIARLRTQLMSEKFNNETRLKLESKLSGAIGNIIVAFEVYPELKTNEHFTRLQLSLNEVEEQISAARRFYNSAVTEYNNALEMFPTNILAASMSYKPKQLFQANAQERQNVNVGSLFNQ
ncbi:putative lemA protein [Calothrix sp. NIES-4071]|nr:putative lemA protein [Calothrix sp. NIES-4071]BAZ63874.1 putative lemA protein [Calothrix sp. NIES-4105]